MADGGNKVGRGAPHSPSLRGPTAGSHSVISYLITASQGKKGVSPPGQHRHRRVPLPQSPQAALPPTPTATHTPGPGIAALHNARARTHIHTTHMRLQKQTDAEPGSHARGRPHPQLRSPTPLRLFGKHTLTPYTLDPRGGLDTAP